MINDEACKIYLSSISIPSGPCKNLKTKVLAFSPLTSTSAAAPSLYVSPRSAFHRNSKSST